MALTSDGERKSMRRVLRNAEKQQVLAVHLSHDPREIVLQVERLNQEYCDQHPEEVQEAVSSFLEDANVTLKDAGHVMISQ